MPSLRRRRSVATGDPEPLPAPVAADRPRGEWASLPPVGTVAARLASAVGVPHRDFRAALATMWSAPPALQPLAHDLTPSAPAGLITAHAAPVTAYDGAPLRFAPVVPGDADPATPVTPVTWSLPRRPDPAPLRADERPPGEPGARPGLLDRLLGRTPSPAAATGETGPAPAGARRTTDAAPQPPPTAAARPAPKSAQQGQPVPSVAPVPAAAASAPVGTVSRFEPPAATAEKRRGPAPAVESAGPAGPLRFRPTAGVAVPPTAGRHGPVLTGDTPGAPGPLLANRVDDAGGGAAPAAVTASAAAAASGGGDHLPVPALVPDDGAEADERRPATVEQAARETPASAGSRPTADPAADDESATPSPSPADDDTTDGHERRGPDGPVGYTVGAGPGRSRPAGGSPAQDGFVPTTRYLEPEPEPEPRALRALVGRRPLGAHLLDAGRGTAPARPVAGFLPATLPDPVQPREAAVDRRGAAPARPAQPGTDGAAHRPSGGSAGDDHPAYVSMRGDTQADPTDPPPATPGELPPGLPDWWPSDSGSWSVRDVDPFQASAAEPAVPDVEQLTRDREAPAVDGAPAIQQRIRPTRDPATGRPASGRVPFPGLPADGGPALRQVRRPRPAAAEPAAHRPFDPHLPLHDRDPVVEAPADAAALPSTADRTSATAAAPAPASAAAPGPAAPAPMSAEDVADHVRHALLVERERSGALADLW